MVKLGRNEPCRCGSGRKYKQCCLGAERPSLKERLPEVLQTERTRAEAMARRWLGVEPEDSEASPLRDHQGRQLLLVADRFRLEDVEALAALRALGRDDGERVLFYDGDQWIGEADCSVPGEVLLVTPSRQLGDRLLALVGAIPGLVHRERTVDPLDLLPSSGGGGGSELLQFKVTFFQAWLDEPNQKLDQATPREAARSEALRPRLVRLLTELERKEARLDAEQRYDFADIRRELGV